MYSYICSRLGSSYVAYSSQEWNAVRNIAMIAYCDPLAYVYQGMRRVILLTYSFYYTSMCSRVWTLLRISIYGNTSVQATQE